MKNEIIKRLENLCERASIKGTGVEEELIFIIKLIKEWMK